MGAPRDAFTPDPVLGAFLGLCPLVAAARDFASGMILGLGVALSVPLLGLAARSLRTMAPERLRAPGALVLAAGFAAVYALIIAAYSPLLATGLDIYLPLLAANCLTLAALKRGLRSEQEGGGGLRGMVIMAGFYLLAAMAISALRELVGLGRLSLPHAGLAPRVLVLTTSPPFRLLASPAGGFMLLGLVAAVYRWALRRRGRRLP